MKLQLIFLIGYLFAIPLYWQSEHTVTAWFITVMFVIWLFPAIWLFEDAIEQEQSLDKTIQAAHKDYKKQVIKAAKRFGYKAESVNSTVDLTR